MGTAADYAAYIPRVSHSSVTEELRAAYSKKPEHAHAWSLHVGREFL